MSRQKFNVGQEIVSQDLNSLQGRLERGIFDRVIYEMLQRKTDGFFGQGLKIVYQSSIDFVVKAGLGFQSIDSGTKEPVKKPIVLEADKTVSINSPDSSNPRIDIVCVRATQEDDETENRKFKDEFTDEITTTLAVVSQDWVAEVLYVAGSPSVTPSPEVTPAGYIKIAEIYVDASTGIDSQDSITDKRSLLPLASSSVVTGSNDYDAIVGDTDQVGFTHADLKSALDNSADGWKILVTRSEEVNAIPVVLKNNIEIVFKRGATISKGTSSKGLQIDGLDCKVVNPRFSGFNTGGDKAIDVSATAERTIIEAPRFLNCATEINDNGEQTYVNVSFTE